MPELGLRHLAVDPGLFVLERLDVDGVQVVGTEELVALVGELAETSAEEDGGFRSVPLALGHLRSERPLQPSFQRARDPDIRVEAFDCVLQYMSRDVASSPLVEIGLWLDLKYQVVAEVHAIHAEEVTTCFFDVCRPREGSPSAPNVA